MIHYSLSWVVVTDQFIGSSTSSSISFCMFILHIYVFSIAIFLQGKTYSNLSVLSSKSAAIFTSVNNFSLFQSQIFFLSLLLKRVHDQLDCCCCCCFVSSFFSFVLFCFISHQLPSVCLEAFMLIEVWTVYTVDVACLTEQINLN